MKTRYAGQPPLTEIGRRIVALAERNQYTLSDLAAYADVPQSTFLYWVSANPELAVYPSDSRINGLRERLPELFEGWGSAEEIMRDKQAFSTVRQLRRNPEEAAQKDIPQPDR